MNAIEEARKYYDKYTNGELAFRWEVAECAFDNEAAFVCTPELFVMAWPVRSGRDTGWWREHQPCENPDAWYIHLLCGDLKKALEVLPKLAKPLPYVVFQRGARSHKVHKYKYDKLVKKGGVL